MIKNLPANTGDTRDVGLIPESGRSFGVGNGKWKPTPVFLTGKFHRQRSMVGYSPWGCKESDMTEYTPTDTHTHIYFFLPFHSETCRGKAKKPMGYTELGEK